MANCLDTGGCVHAVSGVVTGAANPPLRQYLHCNLAPDYNRVWPGAGYSSSLRANTEEQGDKPTRSTLWRRSTPHTIFERRGRCLSQALTLCLLWVRHLPAQPR